jgi:hypothetical protein
MSRPKSPSFSFIALKASSPGARITGTAAVRIANTPRLTANPAKPQRRDEQEERHQFLVFAKTQHFDGCQDEDSEKCEG